MMGNTWEVNEYIKMVDSGYGYDNVYRGESLLKAIMAMYRSKKNGSGCVRLEWR